MITHGWHLHLFIRTIALGLSDTSSTGSLAPPLHPAPALGSSAGTPSSSAVAATPTSASAAPPSASTSTETPPLLPRGSHVAVPPSRPLPTSPSHQAQTPRYPWHPCTFHPLCPSSLRFESMELPLQTNQSINLRVVVVIPHYYFEHFGKFHVKLKVLPAKLCLLQIKNSLLNNFVWQGQTIKPGLIFQWITVMLGSTSSLTKKH